jgi:hypothetical protein
VNARESRNKAAPNGEVEGPDDQVSRAQRARNVDWVPRRPSAADQASRAHNILLRPRRQAADASRPPPTIVRGLTVIITTCVHGESPRN